MTALSLTIHDPSVVVITGENLAVEVRASNSPETANDIHERPSTNDKASPEAGPQAEAFQGQGTGAGTLADREGRHEGEAASVDLPTIFDAAGDADAIRAGHITQYHVMQLRGAWSKANTEARSIFLAEFNLSFIAAPGVAAEATGNDLREPVAAEQGQIIREGDAPRETGRLGGDASCPDTESPSGGDAFVAVKGKARLANAAGVEPSPSVTISPDPRDPQVDDGQPAPSSNAAGVKSDAPHIVGQGGHEPVGHFGEFEHQSASAAQARNEPGSASGASVTNFPSAAPAETGEAPSPRPASPVIPVSKRLRPHCLHPELCASGTRDHCHACKKAMAESEAA